MKALILNREQKIAAVQEIAKPTPAPSELLIKVQAVALNPIDSLYVSNPLGATGRTVGSDFSGTIVSQGSSVPASSNLLPGVVVAGFLQGACSVNDRPGAFADYVVCPWDLVWKVPKSLGVKDAAAVSLGALTAAQSVFYRLGLKAPFDFPGAEAKAGSERETANGPVYVFIYGASTSVGMYAAQLVRRSAEVSGRKVVLLGAAGKRRIEMLKAEPYAYDELVDYQDKDWCDQIRQLSGGDGVSYALDCISEGATVSMTSQTVRKSGGRMAILRSRQGGAWKSDALPVEPIYGAVWEGLGVEIQYQGFVVKASAEAREFAVAFYKWLSAGGKLQPNPTRSMPGGLEKIVEDGFALLGPGSMEHRTKDRVDSWMKPISGEKLVYEIIQ
jgi:NADPH:quinone reductase-like Zn-dependent oxidoreductase